MYIEGAVFYCFANAILDGFKVIAYQSSFVDECEKFKLFSEIVSKNAFFPTLVYRGSDFFELFSKTLSKKALYSPLYSRGKKFWVS